MRLGRSLGTSAAARTTAVEDRLVRDPDTPYRGEQARQKRFKICFKTEKIH